MNFTNRRFSSPSICEYPTLEENSSPTKDQSSANPFMSFKRYFLAFQQAQNEEKQTREIKVMINFPNHVKPDLHLPKLGANQFNQLQTKHWRPGDQSRHPGGPSNVPEEPGKFVPCTSNHRIRRILIYHNLPYLEACRFDAITHGRPSHQNYHVLEFFLAYPGVPICTSTHQIKPNPIRPEDRPGILKLAKLTCFIEILQTKGDKDQRPYSHSRSLSSISGRLLNHGHVQKLSRYKGSQVSINGAPNHAKRPYSWSHQCHCCQDFIFELFSFLLSFYDC